MSNQLVWRSMLYVPANNSSFVNKAHTRGADAIILAVAHKKFQELGVDGVCDLLTENSVVVDVKRMFASDDFKDKKINYWRL